MSVLERMIKQDPAPDIARGLEMSGVTFVAVLAAFFFVGGLSFLFSSRGESREAVWPTLLGGAVLVGCSLWWLVATLLAYSWWWLLAIVPVGVVTVCGGLLFGVLVLTDGSKSASHD
ncbi:hypothetical protein [Nocardia sp. NBC_00511]|uniref:hypothetical protein n=1 Tax=Nocardia sp. NBC_00511 TaxID=2903591 RepID=UPI0030E53B3C